MEKKASVVDDNGNNLMLATVARILAPPVHSITIYIPSQYHI
jgi:hypothetical protein